jgi:hypothetical protein
MAYGTIKVDTITFTDAGVDKSVTISGLVQNPTFSGNITVTGTVSGNTIQGQTVSGATITGGAAVFTTVTGGVATITSGVFALGSASNPSISFTGDANSGLYSPGADQVAISTGGSGRLFVDASGNVGVKTSSPFAYGIGAANLSNLQVEAGQYGVITLGSTTGGVGQKYWRMIGRGNLLQIQSINDDGTAEATAIQINKGTAQAVSSVQFFANGVQRLQISGDSPVGSTATPTSLTLDNTYRSSSPSWDALKLNLYKSATEAYGFGVGADADLHYYAGDASSGVHAFYTSRQERLRITSAGLVGIGTSSPSTNLHIGSGSGTGLGVLLSRGVTTNFFEAHDGTKTFIGGTDNTNAFVKVGSLSNHPVAIVQGNASAIYIDTSQRVGIGTTTASETLHVAGNALIAGTSQSTLTVGSSSFAGPHFANVRGGGNSLNFGYQLANTPRLYSNTLDANQTTIASNNSNIVFMQSAGGSEHGRWDPSGRLLVGTSTSAVSYSDWRLQISGQAVLGSYLGATASAYNFNFIKSRSSSVGTYTIVASGDKIGGISFNGDDGTDYETPAALIEAYVDGTPGANDMPGRLVFSTTADGASSPTERMRIGQDGGTYWRSNAATATHDLGNFNTSITGEVITASAYRNTVNDTFKFLTCVRQGFAVALEIRDDGDVYNVNGTYGSLSDVKLKENIVDAQSQWDDIRQLRVRNYNFKPETNNSTHKQIGVIAQEIENVSPGLVNTVSDRDAEGNDLGTVTKSVNYSVLYMKAVKALQEAMERIETLEAKVAALESA